MDLISSIRKQGSRGGVNFSWDEVSTSQHRENYLGHSLMAPVGRWQKGKDLSWYVKGDEVVGKDGESAEEKKARERREEIRRIKEAEEDALARALGLPVTDRTATGSNSVSVGEVNRAVKDAGVGEDDDGVDTQDVGRSNGFGDFVGKLQGAHGLLEDTSKALEQVGLAKRVGEREGLAGKREHRSRSLSRDKRHRRDHHRSRSGERRRHRSGSGERHHRRKHDGKEERRLRNRSVDRRDPDPRSRSPDRHRGRLNYNKHRRDSDRRRRSRSPEARRRDRDTERRR